MHACVHVFIDILLYWPLAISYDSTAYGNKGVSKEEGM